MKFQEVPALTPETIMNVPVIARAMAREQDDAESRSGTPQPLTTHVETAVIRVRYPLPISAEATVDGEGGLADKPSEAKHSSSAPIHLLPPELLTRVFLLAHPGGWLTRTALILARVCRYWREVVMSTAAFWTDVRAGQVDLASQSVELSRQAPLKFLLAESFLPILPDYDEDHPYGYCVLPDSAVDLLVRNIGRVRSLEVRVHAETYMMLLPRFAPLAAPSLEALNLFITEEDYTEYHTSYAALLTGSAVGSRSLFDAASIEHFSLRTRMLRAPITIYPHLASLALELGSGSLHDSDFILGTMRAHPTLRDLRLVLSAPVLMQGNELRAHMPLLKHLSLIICEPEDASYFLYRMDLPSLPFIELEFLGTNDYDMTQDLCTRLIQVLLPLPEALRNKLMNAEFSGEGSQLTITLKHRPWDPPSLLVQFRCYQRRDEYIQQIIGALTVPLRRLTIATYGRSSWVLKRSLEL